MKKQGAEDFIPRKQDTKERRTEDSSSKEPDMKEQHTEDSGQKEQDMKEQRTENSGPEEPGMKKQCTEDSGPNEPGTKEQSARARGIRNDMFREKLPALHSIQTRMSGVLLAALVFVLCMNLFILSQINSAVQRIDAVFSSNVTINTLSDTLDLVQSNVYEYLSTKSSLALENYYRYEQDYRSLIAELNNRNVESRIKMLEKNIRYMSESYLEQTSITVQAKRGRNVERYKDSYETETQLYSYIQTYIYELNTLLFHQNSENYQVLLSSMDVLEKGSLVIMLFVFFVCVLIATLLVRDMIRPLTALSFAAHEVARGHFDVPLLPVVFDDEVGIVTHGFNQMLLGIRENIEKLKESMEKEAQLKERELSMEAHLKEAQLKYLQAQINPHFLFNSLNAGAQLALMEDAEQTELFLEKMADFFRYNVRKMGGDSTLAEEVAAVDNYIYILNVRFAGDITYRKTIDADLENIRIPSMILQPLVENAVQHGIHDCMEEGWIHLEVSRRGASLKIVVSDNGEGMTQEKIRAILDGSVQQSNDVKYSTGIALDNIIHRLHLYYRQENSRESLVEIESDGPGCGTRVTITLPAE